jgi:16S rRNA (cytosine967-C5)-methyltransferase
MERLQAENIGATLGKLSDSAIYLDKPAPVNDIPGFNEGLLSIQDEASQLVPGLLHLEPGLRVLDACAAPGGKTCHLIESEDLLTQMVCIDRAQAKLKRIEENLQRLHLQAKLIEADAADTNQWWDGNQFERILLDAPCSATGVIRRHPDIKLLRRPSDIENLTKIQFQLLNNLWACLKPGGLLLYTTCSLLRQENEEVLRRFLDSCDSAKHEAIVADWGVECALGRQLLPSTGLGPDGFFYAVLRKSK